MDNTLSLSDDREQLSESDLPTGVATLDTGVDEELNGQHAEWTGPRCEKCDAPIKSDTVAICRSCGWYASLGTYVEVDPSWEVDEEADDEAAEQAGPSHLEVWLNLLPRWAWILIASVVAVIVQSAVARLVTPADSQLRTTWSLAQLTIGALVFAGYHVFNFLTVAAEDADMGVLDLVLKPVKAWIRTCRRLPARLWVVDAAACGLTAAVMSLVVIGGIPYHVLWNWGFKQPPKQNLMGAVMSRMQSIEDKGGADNLEDAVRDFAESQNVEPEPSRPKPTPPKPRERADCVILGYRADADGRVTTLILAAAHRGKLVYAGYVTPQLADDEMADLARQLDGAKAEWPFLPIQATAIWVDPKFTCRVTFRKRSEGGRLQDVQWERLLGEMRMP